MNINSPYESCGSRNDPYQEIVLLYSGQYTLCLVLYIFIITLCKYDVITILYLTQYSRYCFI